MEGRKVEGRRRKMKGKEEEDKREGGVEGREVEEGWRGGRC